MASDTRRTAREATPQIVAPAAASTAKPVTIGDVVRGQMDYLTSALVMQIHMQLVDDYATSDDPITPAGTIDRGKLFQSALGRPRTSLGRVLKYPTVEMAGAALLHALIHDHPFINGNKRTAIVSLLVFHDLNGLVATADEDELFDFAIALAGHDMPTVGKAADDETNYAAQWLSANSRAVTSDQRRMRWCALRTILAEHGCSFEQREGNSIAIRRGQRVTVAGARNDGDEIDKPGVLRIRRELGLTDKEGIDSAVFYGTSGEIPAFIQKYRKTLDRLAAYG